MGQYFGISSFVSQPKAARLINVSHVARGALTCSSSSKKFPVCASNPSTSSTQTVSQETNKNEKLEQESVPA